MAEILLPSKFPTGTGTGPRRPTVFTAEELAPHFPQYEILRLLGRGGMGAVYLARQTSLDRLVAIKILPADAGDEDLNFAERFKNEARAMAKLSHPGIVAVHDFGETANGLLFIVMEYIEGTDVAQMVASQGRLHSAHAMAITAHVCDALQYAHSRGIIHRDIKPSNIMVDSTGVVKVADFGLAKMNHGGQTAGLTQSGVTMGTLHFMAPEALMLGSAVDQRADIYAVGVMLYQMLTGKLPQGMFEMPSFQVPGLDPRYDSIVAKALREDRALRYQDAGELRHDLDTILTQPVVKVEPEESRAPAAIPAAPPPGQVPKRGPGQIYRPPPSRTPVAKPKSNAGLMLAVAAVVIAVIAAFFFLGGTGGKGGTTSDPMLATKEKPFVNSLGMKFVPVPGTKVLFCIHETRRQDYSAYAAENPGMNDSWKHVQQNGIPVSDKDSHPVAAISWEDASSFCQWLTKKEGVKYRLPTDREWSFAIGIADLEPSTATPQRLSEKVKTYPWDGDWPPLKPTGNYADTKWKELFPNMPPCIPGYTDGFASAAPVMSFPPNKLGIHDLGGNAWEWCDDWWNESKTEKTLRGASWNNYETYFLLSSCRPHVLVDRRSNDYGFRVVLELPDANSKPEATAKTPAEATKGLPFANTIGMKFVPVPGTRVLFCIHETRRKDYEAYAHEAANVASAWNENSRDGVPVQTGPEYPVVNVSWDDSKAFCEWLSRKEGRAYRLATDREWSCAVGIGDREAPNATPESLRQRISDTYPWGSTWPPPAGSGNFADESSKNRFNPPRFIIGYNDGYDSTSPVMAFPPNALGIHDLAGNTWQWCADFMSPENPDRVRRGSSWIMSEARDLLSSHRPAYAGSLRDGYTSFRVVLELSDATKTTEATAKTPAEATKGLPFANTIGMKFVPVPGTKVLFCIHETRRRDYETYGGMISSVSGEWKFQHFSGVPCGHEPDHPVVGVSWVHANQFCSWLSAKEGVKYRLPTDQEWSMAVGLGTKEKRDSNSTPENLRNQVQDEYPWEAGLPLTSQDRAGNYADSALKAALPQRPVIEGLTDGFATTAPVMSFKPNRLGLYDMGGNVWEWVEDYYDTTRTERTLRGGCFDVSAQFYLLSAVRQVGNPEKSIGPGYGFRVVLELPSS